MSIVTACYIPPRIIVATIIISAIIARIIFHNYWRAFSTRSIVYRPIREWHIASPSLARPGRTWLPIIPQLLLYNCGRDASSSIIYSRRIYIYSDQQLMCKTNCCVLNITHIRHIELLNINFSHLVKWKIFLVLRAEAHTHTLTRHHKLLAVNLSNDCNLILVAPSHHPPPPPRRPPNDSATPLYIFIKESWPWPASAAKRYFISLLLLPHEISKSTHVATLGYTRTCFFFAFASIFQRKNWALSLLASLELLTFIQLFALVFIWTFFSFWQKRDKKKST